MMIFEASGHFHPSKCAKLLLGLDLIFGHIETHSQTLQP